LREPPPAIVEMKLASVKRVVVAAMVQLDLCGMHFS
jgi:hypothetical protein